MPDDAARRRVAAEQAGLLAALLARDGAPAGFDAARVKLAASTLLSKRRKGVVKTWPSLVGSLGDAFAAQFDAFARERPPEPGGPAADGYAFARWLDARRLLPPAAAPSVVAQSLWRGRRVGMVVRAPGARRLVVGVRAPLLGVRVASFPWFA